MSLRVITLPPADRPAVEVLVNREWCFGVLRQWVQRDDATWWGDVQWTRTGETRLDHFPADRIREDTVDRSCGRDPDARRPPRHPA